MPPRPPPKRLTHFLCIPLVTPTSRHQLSTSLKTFRTDKKTIRSPENPSGIPEAAVRPLGSLHLTLGVMSLLTPERVEGALALLRSLDLRGLLAASVSSSASTSAAITSNQSHAVIPSILKQATPLSSTESIPKHNAQSTSDPPSLTVTLRGLTSMHDPATTSILYAPPLDPSGHLQRFCESLKDIFTAADFLVPENRPLLLHATVVNTVYVPAAGVRGSSSSNSNDRGGRGKRKGKLMLDVRGMLERYVDFEWIKDVRVEKVAICRMGARKVVDEEGRETGDEAYAVEGEVDLPFIVLGWHNIE